MEPLNDDQGETIVKLAATVADLSKIVEGLASEMNQQSIITAKLADAVNDMTKTLESLALFVTRSN